MHCGRDFAKETTLIGHACERKRRLSQESDIGVNWGYRAYVTFRNHTCQSSTDRYSYADFTTNRYYQQFVKFGRYCHAVKCLNFESYLKYLLKKNIKWNKWTSDQVYEIWLQDYVYLENVNDAIARSVINMTNIKQYFQTDDFQISDFFTVVNHNRVCSGIAMGQISPWVIYHCKSGQDFLASLNLDQEKNILPYIDPCRWQKKFQEHTDDVAVAKQVLEKLGL